MNIKLLIQLLIMPGLAIAFTEQDAINQISNQRFEVSKEQLDKNKDMDKQIAEKGYVTANVGEEIRYLKNLIKKTLHLKSKNFNVESDIEKDIASIKLDFSYKSVIKGTTGYVPQGAYSESGWSGLKEMFLDLTMGACYFSVFHLPKNGYSPTIDHKKFINGKDTDFTVKGNANEGYVYTLEWFEERYFRTLECAQKDESERIMDNMISLAQKIDKESFG